MNVLYAFILLTSISFLEIEGFERSATNHRPIIGILSVEQYDSWKSKEPNGSYIAASYVKMVESSGARVVPIMPGQSEYYYREMVNSVNGVLLPGGGATLTAKGGYGEAARILYELALEINEKGTPFPLYGVCLGFEILIVASAQMKMEVLSAIEHTSNVALALHFISGFRSSSLFKGIPRELVDHLTTRAITSNHHSKCLKADKLEFFNLTDTWRPLTTSESPEGVSFISTIEHVRFPQIFATQFHPEKPAFEWTKKGKDNHELVSLTANRWFYDRFVQHARTNNHHFQNNADETSNLIYNYNPIYKGTYFEQKYEFPNGTYHVSRPENNSSVLQ